MDCCPTTVSNVDGRNFTKLKPRSFSLDEIRLTKYSIMFEFYTLLKGKEICLWYQKLFYYLRAFREGSIIN